MGGQAGHETLAGGDSARMVWPKWGYQELQIVNRQRTGLPSEGLPSPLDCVTPLRRSPPSQESKICNYLQSSIDNGSIPGVDRVRSVVAAVSDRRLCRDHVPGVDPVAAS